MSVLLKEMKSVIADGLRSHTLTSCSRWSAVRRFMPCLHDPTKEQPYSWEHHPWIKEPLDSGAPFNYFMKGAQLGVTEAAINRCLYTIDQLKRDVLYVLPTAINASDFSKSRFKTALATSPHLARIFTDTNTVNLKQAGTKNLYIRGSRGDSNLKSIPASVLILDEVDEMDQKQIWLAMERLSGQLSKQVWAVSTPTIPEYGIHKLYKNSTQEHFHFRCPSCSGLTKLVWPDCVEIIGEHLADPRCAESFLKCKECGAKLPHETKPDWLGTAQWIAEAKNSNPEIRGFHVSQLYSYTVTPGELVVAHFRGFGDELATKEFHNSKLGQPFIGDGAKVTDEMLERAIRPHTKDGTRPQFAGERFVTMGVDQGKWSYVSVCEWFIRKVTNDLNATARCRLLWEGRFFEDDWHMLDELMRDWQVLGCVIDADPETNEARRFARRYPGYVWLCRYRRGQSAREITITDDDDGAPIATVDRSNWLSATMGRFKSDPTRIELPKDVSIEYREHMKNVVRTYVRDVTKEGRRKGSEGNARLQFVSTGPDHFAHAQNYAEIALPLAASVQNNVDISSLL